MSPIPTIAPTLSRKGAAWGLVVAVAAAHVVALDPWLAAPLPAHARAGVVQVRQIVVDSGAGAAAVDAAAVRTTAALPAKAATRLAPDPAGPAEVRAEGAIDATAGPPAAPGEPDPYGLPPAGDGATTLPAANAAVRPAPSSAGAGQDGPATAVPVYATVPAPSMRLHFDIERGSQRGTATLDWSVDDDRYTLRLQAEIEGRPALGSVSRGAFDPAGLAPERFVETRNRRELRAANFEREAGEVRFSGPGHRAELAPGAQDRLSWWLQLAAVLQAEPALRKVTLSVTGARGDSRVWTFAAVPAAPEDDGSAGLLHFHRAAEHPYDTEVDVWLDPALHHLPARMRLRFRQGGDVTTFTRSPGR